MRVLAERPVLATNVTAFMTGVAMFGSFLMVPQFALTPESTGYGFGMSVTQAGLIMVPSSIVMLIAGPFAGSLGNRFGFRPVLVGGTIATIVSFVVLTLAHDTVLEFIIANALIGLGIAFSFASMANLVVASVHPSEVGIATGINTIMRTIGGAFGSALVAAILTAETAPGTGLPTEAAYTEGFAISAVGALLALVAALLIPRVHGDRDRPEPAPGATPATARA